MSQTFAKRNNLLEMEENTTKDAIWRLTNRVCVLESEFKRLKDLLKRSILLPSSGVEIARNPKSGKIAQEQKQPGDDCYINFEHNDVEVKTEIDSYAEFNDSETSMDYMSNEGSPTDSLGIYESKILENVDKVETVANVNVLENFDTEDDYNTIVAEAISLNPSGLGRKKTPIWRHYIRKPKPETPDRPNRKYACIAICKNCKVEVSAQARRMTLHLEKCLSGRLKKTPRGKLKKEDQSVNPPKKSILFDVPQFSGIIEGSNETGIQNQIAYSTSVEIDGATITNFTNSDKTPLSDFDDHALNSAASVLNSSIPTPGPRSKNASTVWQHYNIIKEKICGTTCITSATCKSCNKVVSAKVERLALHLKKCQAAKTEK